MAIPKQVQAQLNEAEAIEKRFYGEAGDNAAHPEGPVGEVVTPEAEQSTDDRAPKGSEQDPGDDAAHAPDDDQSTSQSREGEEKPERPDEDVAHWRQKYKTLQGMYDADVPRLHAQVKDLTTQVDELNSRLEKADEAAERDKQDALRKQRENLVTDDERREFGDDLLEVQRKIAREENAEILQSLDDLKKENARLRAQMDDTGTQLSTASFKEQLNRLVPDFEQVNADPAWIAWLNEFDPMLRGPRKAAAQQAYSEGDAAGVAHYVNLFKEQNKAPEPEVPDPKRQAEIDNQIQPSRSAPAAGTKTEPKGKTYTSADIAKMFKRVTELGVAGRVDEAKKLEAIIDSAYMDDRVVG